ncbi:MAG: hypothetical protein KF836_06315 [Fimbriimonadaceae bacterium]|nr:hypothetical protein [Fimbriimonadaceae bacterium]
MDAKKIISLVTMTGLAVCSRYAAPGLVLSSIENADMASSQNYTEQSVTDALVIYEQAPSWEYFLKKSNHKNNSEYSKKWLSLIEDAKKLSKHDNESLSRAVQLYCGKYSKKGNQSLFLLAEKNSVFLLNRLLFDVPYSEPEGSTCFVPLSLNEDDSVRRLWPIENDNGNLKLVDVTLVLTGNHDYDAYQEFLYYAKSFKRRIFE